ncbi:MAG: 30S ribosomal protein S7, partial [Betaproteobacteria bacterium]|nr:30S ribosomal protein S7 [Betaproteobacteria bacterium]
VRAERALALAMRWLCQAMRAGGDKHTHRNLANELMEASSGRGAAVKKRDDTHRMAAANKAFSHFRY